MSYPKKVMKAIGREFTVEEMIDWGKKQITGQDIDYDNLHKYIIALLEFELGVESGAKGMIGNNKSFYNVVKSGTQITAFVALTMNRFAKTELKNLGYIRTNRLKAICNREIKKHDKYSFEGFYYRSGLRYLRATGLR